MALSGISLLTAIYLELVQGRSASLTGWLLLSMPLLMAVLSPVSGRLSDRVGSRVLTTGGMVAVATGMVLLALNPESAPLWRVAACLGVVGLGMAAFSAPNTSAIMGSVRRDQLSRPAPSSARCGPPARRSASRCSVASRPASWAPWAAAFC